MQSPQSLCSTGLHPSPCILPWCHFSHFCTHSHYALGSFNLITSDVWKTEAPIISSRIKRENQLPLVFKNPLAANSTHVNSQGLTITYSITCSQHTSWSKDFWKHLVFLFYALLHLPSSHILAPHTKLSSFSHGVWLPQPRRWIPVLRSSSDQNSLRGYRPALTSPTSLHFKYKDLYLL